MLRITVKDPDERKVGRAVSNAVIELGAGDDPGLLRRRRRPRRRPAVRRVLAGASCPAELVPQHVVVLGGDAHRGRVRSAPAGDGRRSTRRPSPTVPRRRAARPCGRRSAASSAPGRATRAATRTSACSRAPTRRGRGSTPSSPSSGCGSCCRRRRRSRSTVPLPNIRSLNFVIHGLLEEGVAASTRQDAQAKSLGECLRAKVVDVPVALLGSIRPSVPGRSGQRRCQSGNGSFGPRRGGPRPDARPSRWTRAR